MFRSRTTTAASRAKAARELERQLMTMEVVSGDNDDDSPAEAAAPAANSQHPVALPDRLVFGPYGITPLLGLHYDAKNDTATS